MIDTLEPLHATIERGSTTLNERTFLDSYSNDLTQAHECIRRFQRTKDQRELHQAWDLYHQVFKRIHAQLPNITSLELDYVSPRKNSEKKIKIFLYLSIRSGNTLSGFRISCTGYL
jgi:FKBP12-rapamycin complex-associated protein